MENSLKDISFRPCQLQDVEVSARLILSSGDEEFRYVFGLASADQALEFLPFAFVRVQGQFSYTHHTAILSQNRHVGIGGVWSQTEYRSCFWSTLQTIFSFYGFFNGLRVVCRGVQAEAVMKPPRKGVGLIYDLAISAEQRGRGLGKALVDCLQERIGALHLQKAGLDVSSDNPRAKELYQRLGFKQICQNSANLKNKHGRISTHFYLERVTPSVEHSDSNPTPRNGE